MPKFFTTKDEVALGPGQTLGFKKGSGYYAKGVPIPYAGYQSPAQIAKAAGQQATAALAPSQAEIERQKAEAQGRTDVQAKHLEGFSKAIADIVGGIGPGIEGAHGAAADRQAVLAKGYSIGLQLAQQGSANEANQLLEQQGSPQRIAGDQGAADVLYGLGGFNPATVLNTSGAAFGAAARMLPATELGRGQDALRQLYGQSREQDKQFDQMLRELKLRYPSVYQEAVAAFQNQQRELEQVDIARRYLLDEQRNTGADITGIDPATGLPTYDATSDAAAAAAASDAARKAARGTAIANRTQALSDARKTALDLAKELRGKPILSGDAYLPAYKAEAGGYTNDEDKAAYTGRASWQEAFNAIYAAIADDLKARYAIKDPQIHKLIRERLIALGYKPPARKTKKGDYGYPGSGVGGQSGGRK